MASPASNDTILDPPVWGFNPAGNQGDFARLVPKSPLARRAFAEVVQRMQEDPFWNIHARRFIHFAEYIDPNSDSDATNVMDDDMPSHDVQWYGYYRLNWDIAPAQPRLGWVLGSSRLDQSETVDLLLTPRPGQFRVGGRHCRLAHNPQSGALLVRAENHRVTVDGTVTLRRNSRVVYRNTGILINDLAYTLEFTDLDPSISRTQLQKSLRIQHADSRHPSAPVLTPTPNGAVSECGGYVVHATVAGGSFGAVSYGSHIGTGASVAIKRVRASQDADHEISLLRSMDHENVCRIEKVMNASGSFVPNPIEDLLIVITPLVTCTLAEYTLVHLHSDELLTIMAQFISGVQYIHHEGIMHRDIKPANVGVVVQPENLQVILLDFGHATKDSQSSDHMKGTVPYLAPEVIALKWGHSSAPYNNSVDVWAMGLCMFGLASRAQIRWKCVTVSRYKTVTAKLGLLESKSNYLEQKCINLIGKMLAWEPAHRLTATELMATMPTISRRPDSVNEAMPPPKRSRKGI